MSGVKGMTSPRASRAPIERVLDRLVVSPCGCWPWPGGYIESRGGAHYGVVNAGRRGAGMVLVHRVSYEWFTGPIEYEIDHRCETTLCWNPEHLRDVEHAVNQEWMLGNRLAAR